MCNAGYYNQGGVCRRTIVVCNIIGQILNDNNVCVCRTGKISNGTNCVCSIANQILDIGNNCVCRPRQSVLNNLCVCNITGQTFNSITESC